MTLPSKKGDPARRVTLPAEPTFFFFHVNGSASFVRKCRKSWLAQGSSGRRVTLLPGTTFLHIKGALVLSFLYSSCLHYFKLNTTNFQLILIESTPFFYTTSMQVFVPSKSVLYSSCMYVIVFYSDKNESLALLFKIITKIWLLSRQASADEPDILVVEDRLAGMLSQTSCFDL